MEETSKITAEEMGIKSWMKASSSQKTDLNTILHSSKADYRGTCSDHFLMGTLISLDRDWKEQNTGSPWRQRKKPKRDRCKGEVTFSDLFHLIGQKHTSLGPFVQNKGRLEMASAKNNPDWRTNSAESVRGDKLDPCTIYVTEKYWNDWLFMSNYHSYYKKIC